MFYVIKNGELNEWSDKREALYFKDEAKELTGVTVATFDEYKYKPVDGILIDISDTDEYKEKQEQEHRDRIKAEFIKTSLGLYRKQPKGYSNAVESMNVIFNMVNAKGSLTEQIASLVIFYPEPDFSDPKQCTEEWLIANSYNPEPMTLAEFMKFYIEFQTIWAAEQYKN